MGRRRSVVSMNADFQQFSNHQNTKLSNKNIVEKSSSMETEVLQDGKHFTIEGQEQQLITREQFMDRSFKVSPEAIIE